jgi:hypothetical protein
MIARSGSADGLAAWRRLMRRLGVCVRQNAKQVVLEHSEELPGWMGNASRKKTSCGNSILSVK